MTHDELNQYILDYLNETITQSAIMLTAPWGVGKSHYIKHELIPFLSDENNGNHKYIVVSLYGLSSLFEVSRAVYLESRLGKIKPKTEKGIAGSILAKTVLRGLASHFGIDLSTSDEELQKLYESIDLSSRFIIFEDLERSGIDIFDFLGYVNNLVTEDGVKVLLVAYEEEILKNNDGTIGSIESYKRIKEKTVSDTLRFYADEKKAIEGILRSFNHPMLEKLFLPADNLGTPCIVFDICSIMVNVKCHNLRSVIFGCQKAVDIFQKVEAELDEEFSRVLLLGTIAFALRIKTKVDLKWEEKDNLSSPRLGTYVYPLLRVAYDYVHNHSFNKRDLLNAQSSFLQQRESASKISAIKESLEVLYYCVIHTEAEVVDALQIITNSLENSTDIPCNEFGKLANYLIHIRFVVGQEDMIQRCKNAMIRRLRKEGGEQEKQSITFHSGIELINENDKKDFLAWKKEMLNVISQKEQSGFGFVFDYSPESVNDFCKNVNEHVRSFSDRHCFASLFNIKKLIALLKIASPQQIFEIRNSFENVYYMSNIEEYFADDLDSLRKIHTGIQNLLSKKDVNDKVARLNLDFFSEDLLSHIERLSTHGSTGQEEA